LPGDVDLVVAAQPGPDLAVARPGERAGEQDLADQPCNSVSLIEVAGPGRRWWSPLTRRA
jgi:hypothetical protein